MFVSSTSVTVTSPAGTTGTVDVTVTTPVTTSPTTGADQFTYSNTTWFAASPTTSPPLRYQSAEAFDPATGQTIEFGGATSNTGPYLNDTWSWNGANWAQLTPATSPSVRDGATIAYDPAMNGGELVLFGGYNGTTTLSDTWAWTGSNWAFQSPATVPPARQLAAMAYDTATSQLLLFGGNSSGTALNDTWVWSGTNWAAQSPASKPGIRWDVTMAFDPAMGSLGTLVLYGGYSGSSGYGDTWTWSGTNWASSPRRPVRAPAGRKRWPTTPPPPSSSSSAATTAHTSVTRGRGTAPRGASSPRRPPQTALHVHRLRPDHEPDGPVRRYGHLRLHRRHLDNRAPPASPPSAPCRPDGGEHLAHHHRLRVYRSSRDRQRGHVRLDGGGQLHRHLVHLDHRRRVPGRGRRHGRRHGYRQRRHRPQTGADQFAYSNMTWYEAFPTTAPSVRLGSAEAYDPATGQTILFGGNNASTYYNDTWDWNGANWVQLSPATSPSTRMDAAMAYDSAMNGGELVLFGGSNASTNYNDTWAWNGSTWSQVGNTGDLTCTTTCTNSPLARFGASMAYDSANAGQLVLFGGFSAGTTYDNDTWTWNGTSWANVTPTTSLAGRYGASMAYDPVNGGQLVLFGGYNGSAGYNDTWTWNDNTNTWSQLAPAASPAGRYGASMAYDPANGVSWSCSAVTTTALATSATPGTGTGRPGQCCRRPPPHQPLRATPWRTTWPPIRWSSSAATRSGLTPTTPG